MAASHSGFGPDHFQKDQVKRRLRNKAVQLWGLPEADIDNLDPVIDLLFGACAVEFERTANEIHSSQARVLQRLANLMLPEVFTNARPAHSILFAKPEFPSTVLNPETQFTIEKEIQEANKAVKIPVVFSPANSSKLFDASVICQASGNKISFYEYAGAKGDIILADDKETLPPSHFWIGIQINKKIDNLNGMSFFFDWKNESDKEKYLPLIPEAKFHLDGVQLKTRSGFMQRKKDELAEFEVMAELENHVTHLYHNNFINIEEDVKPNGITSDPSGLLKVFSPEKLKKIKEPLLWILIHLPVSIPPQAVNDLYCSINCFPALNRRLHSSNRPHSLSSRLNIIPLQTTDHYLTIKRIHSNSREYKAVSLQKVRELEDGSYSVRQGGVSRFDQRNASTLLNYIHDLLRDESAAFSAFGSFSLNSELKSLEQSLTRLENHLIQKMMPQSSRCHLLLYSKMPEDVWVEFWSTQGEIANGISAGKKSEMIAQAGLKKDSLIFITPSSGGTAPMGEAEKLYAYKYSLLTRSRVVTEEDIKAACYSELGDKIRGVEIRKGIKKDLAAQKGFVKTMEVVVTPSEGFVNINWSEACRELKTFLERKKMFLTDIEVITQTMPEAHVV